jgi:2-polyprenyl-6-methoxyphenol hydroxylase-like FAD-dependent oxidoreductase
MSDGSDGYDYDVIVVGGGPVGQVLGLLLGDRGWRTAVIERWSGPYSLPRACAADHEIARVLQSAGLKDAVEELLHPVATELGHRSSFESADHETLLEIPVPLHSVSGWPPFNTFFQPELERAFGARIEAHPHVSFLRGLEAVEVRDEADAAVVVVAAHDDTSGVESDAARKTLRAAYAVGADGANSLVRERIGSSMSDLDFAFDWLVVDFEQPSGRVWDPYHAQYLDPARPTTVVSVGRDRRRFEFMLLPGETADEMNRPEVAWELMRPWGLTSENTRLTRHATYRFGGRWAQEWREGRLLLAGDAAHLMPPFLGQGMCSGLRDAAGLAWRLHLVLSGEATDELLDTYGPERREHVRQIVEQAVGLGQIICLTDPEAAAARDANLRALATGPGAPEWTPTWNLGPGVHRDGDPVAGALAIHARVRHDGTVARLDDLLGSPRFTLLSAHGDPSEQLGVAAAAAWQRLDGVCAHVGPGADYEDLDGDYAAWFADQGVELVLVRPDFYVFGGGALTDADELVRELSGRLSLRQDARLPLSSGMPLPGS